jgi:predicted regulator of Ras-like GTPase activity (Roadblock/LC7/MglB family)
MSFRTHLERVCEQVPGSVACSVMGFDGISVDTHQVSDPSVDLAAMLVEYGHILTKLRDAADVLQAGFVSEVSINTEKLVTVARVLNADYFLVLALTPEGSYGKARYALRIAAPRVTAELG